jgi:hypothetical protein
MCWVSCLITQFLASNYFLGNLQVAQAMRVVLLARCRTPCTRMVQTTCPRPKSASIHPLVVVAQGISSAITRPSPRNRTISQLLPIVAPPERLGRRILVGDCSPGAADLLVVLLFATPELIYDCTGAFSNPLAMVTLTTFIPLRHRMEVQIRGILYILCLVSTRYVFACAWLLSRI